MTLNFKSYFATLPAASIRADDEFGSMVWEGGTESCGGGSPCWLNWERNWERSDSYENGGGERDWTDPIDLLPADPFGMELSSNLAAAIVGWFEDLGVNSSDCNVYCWNKYYEDGDGGTFHDRYLGLSGHGCGGGAAMAVVEAEEALASTSRGPEEEFPHEGLMLSLGYLGVQDLLSVERACKSFHSAVQNDPLLWRCIHIDSPLSERITDDALLRLTLRAQGSLQCLSLVGCSRITDQGLRKVLENNLRLQKLSVSGCLRLSMEGLVNNLKAFKSSGATGIKHLKLGRLFSLSPEQYEELKMLVGGDEMRQPKPSKPRFYHCDVSWIACDDDDRAIDIEMCPGCEKFKLVFDCPSESCQGKGPESCRACDVCIGRCVQCGRCVNDCRFVETFLLDYLCLSCWKQTPSS